MSSARYGLIVVGVDGSVASPSVLTWASEEAEIRGSRLRVIMGWEEPAYAPYAPMASRIDPTGLARRAQELLNRTLESVWGPAFPDRVEFFARLGNPAQLLIEESKRADLLVLGNRGHSEPMEMWLGSVSQQCSIKAHCPVVVIHHQDARKPVDLRRSVGSAGSVGLRVGAASR